MNDRRGPCMLWDTTAVCLPYILLVFMAVYFGGQPWSLVAPLAAVKAAGWAWPFWMKIGIAAAITAGGCMAMFNPFRAKNIYGGAHWATEPEIKKMQLRGSRGLILGMTVRRIFGLKSANYLRLDKPLSVLVYAPPGTGKTSSLIVPSLLACENSTITLDLKGEIFELTAKCRSHFSRIIRFEPGMPGSTRWNPLSKKELPEDWDRIQLHIGRVAESIIPPKKGDDDDSDYWPLEARGLFRFWALFLVWRDGETNFGQILKESIGAGPQDAVAGALDDYEADLPERIRLEGEPFAKMEGKQFDGVFGTYKAKMALFYDPTVTRNTSVSDFCLRELRKECTSVYLVVSNPDMRRLRPILTLFFELATMNYTERPPEPGEWRVTFMLDEFIRLSRMPQVMTMPAIGRGFGLNAFYILQSFSQLVGLYGQAGADELKNTASYHVIFTQNEQKVAEDISRSIGNRTRTRVTKSSQKGSFLKSVSESEEGVPLIRAQEIMSLPEGQLLLLVQGHFETPIRADACYWFKDRTLKKLVLGMTMCADNIALPNETQAEASQARPPRPAPGPGQVTEQEDQPGAVEEKTETLADLQGLNLHEAFDEDEEEA